ncbi:hypothetical protein EBZ80_19810 [bacterium]|nr:hypothetical protein [bacterium]
MMGSFLSHTVDPLKAMLLPRGSGTPLPDRQCLVLFSDRSLTRYELWWNDEDTLLVQRDCQRNLMIVREPCRVVPVGRQQTTVHILSDNGAHALRFRALSDTLFCVISQATPRSRMWILGRNPRTNMECPPQRQDIALLLAVLCKVQDDDDENKDKQD